MIKTYWKWRFLMLLIKRPSRFVCKHLEIAFVRICKHRAVETVLCLAHEATFVQDLQIQFTENTNLQRNVIVFRLLNSSRKSFWETFWQAFIEVFCWPVHHWLVPPKPEPDREKLWWIVSGGEIVVNCSGVEGWNFWRSDFFARSCLQI
jgi:hypothetical protein